MEEPRNIDDIKNILNVTSSAIMTQIKILISQGLIIHDRITSYNVCYTKLLRKVKTPEEQAGFNSTQFRNLLRRR